MKCNCNDKCVHYDVCGIRKEANNKEWFCFAYREERPTGKWINHQDLFSECSECHFNVAFGLNYCPNCGADMRKEKSDG